MYIWDKLYLFVSFLYVLTPFQGPYKHQYGGLNVLNSFYRVIAKVLMQGKLFQRCTHLLYCSILSLGGNVSTRRMSQPDMGFIFHIKIQWNILVIETIMWIIKIIKIKCFYPPRRLDEHWCIYSCLQIPPREKCFQYTRRVYATAINFPCIKSLVIAVCNFSNFTVQFISKQTYITTPWSREISSFLSYSSNWSFLSLSVLFIHL